MFESIQNLFFDLFSAFSLRSVVDISLTAFLIYKIITWLKGSQAEQIAKGVLIFLLITQISDWIGFVTINYIFKSVLTVGLLAIVIMFQPELRRALERLGSTRFKNISILSGMNKSEETIDKTNIIKELVLAVDTLSKSKTGALIVIERNTLLKDIADTGISLDANVSKELLLNIFFPNTPLHDGAVLINSKNLHIMSAGCLLPLTQNRNLSTELGTRHRSALGMSENSDCFVIVVSEETGIVSYAINGKISRFIDGKTLTSILDDMIDIEDKSSPFISPFKTKGGKKNAK